MLSQDELLSISSSIWFQSRIGLLSLSFPSLLLPIYKNAEPLCDVLASALG